MTPANIRAIRMRCGLSVKECAAVLGLTERQVETMERAKWDVVFMDHYETLARIESGMLDLIEAIVAREPRILVGYMETPDLLQFEPGLRHLGSNMVHRMALAEAQAILNADASAPATDIVELIPDAYAAWLATNGREDSLEAREDWAFVRLAEFKIVPAGG